MESSVSEAQNPLILRCHRLMEAFAKSDEERDFYIDRKEGFLVYVDLDKSQAELDALEKELESNSDRFCAIPKISFYDTKKIMEGFVNEKVYDIDTKEKLLDIIQSKESRDNFIEFLMDQHSELDKWQQYYQERSRIRIIEWLRANQFQFVFEEDLELPKQIMEKLKQCLFQAKVSKEISSARKIIAAKAKTYYSNEALNPRPKRGRPPKQAVKRDLEPVKVTIDIYNTVPPSVRPFLFSPEATSNPGLSAFSNKIDEQDLANRKISQIVDDANLSEKLSALRSLSSKWIDGDDDSDDSEELDLDDLPTPKKAASKVKASTKKSPKKKAVASSGKKTVKKKTTKVAVEKSPKEKKPTKKKSIIAAADKKSPKKRSLLPKTKK